MHRLLYSGDRLENTSSTQKTCYNKYQYGSIDKQALLKTEQDIQNMGLHKIKTLCVFIRKKYKLTRYVLPVQKLWNEHHQCGQKHPYQLPCIDA